MTEANKVIAAYIDAGGTFTSKDDKGRLGRAARAIMLRNSWSLDVMLAAVREFALTKRHPHFLEEWTSETYWKWQDAEHAVRRAQESEPLPEVVAAALRGAVKRL